MEAVTGNAGEAQGLIASVFLVLALFPQWEDACSSTAIIRASMSKSLL